MTDRTRRPRPEELFDPAQLDDSMLRVLGPGLTDVLAAIQDSDRVGQRNAERAWATTAVNTLRISFDLVGLDKVNPSGQYLVAPLHEGFADVLALLQLPLDLSWVIRDELVDLPYFGEYLRLGGHIAIEPESPRASLRTILRHAPSAVESGDSLVMFPQGSLLGIEVSFQPGAFQLAARLGLPLLPVVLTGSHRVWGYPFDRDLHLGQTIRLEVLDPIAPDNAVVAMNDLEKEMKQRALQVVNAPPRHYVPARDGLWEGYRFELDCDRP